MGELSTVLSAPMPAEWGWCGKSTVRLTRDLCIPRSSAFAMVLAGYGSRCETITIHMRSLSDSKVRWTLGDAGLTETTQADPGRELP